MTNIGIVTTPSDDESFAEPVYRFASILEPAAEMLYLFSGGAVARDSPLPSQQTIDIGDGDYLGLAPVDYLLTQLAICYQLIQYRSQLDLVYFHKGAMGLAIPVLIARILGVRTCVIKIGAFYHHRPIGQSLLGKLMSFAQYVSFRAAHGVVVFSESEVDSVPNDNVFVAFSNYRDFEKFNIRTPFEERDADIGFVGRFSEVKGITQVVEAAVELVEANPRLTVRLVGSGPQYDQIKERVANYDQISLTGWVDHQEIVDEYNRIRVQIAPSTSEGLPTGIIEAMGCGVVVLASPVGSIKDLFDHGVTGFYLPDCSPEGIRRAYEEISDHEDLVTISRRARKHVVENYSKQTAEEHFERITASLDGDRDLDPTIGTATDE